MDYFLLWIGLSVIIGIIGWIREGYFLGTMLISLIASPLAGIFYLTHIGFDSSDSLLG